MSDAVIPLQGLLALADEMLDHRRSVGEHVLSLATQLETARGNLEQLKIKEDALFEEILSRARSLSLTGIEEVGRSLDEILPRIREAISVTPEKIEGSQVISLASWRRAADKRQAAKESQSVDPGTLSGEALNKWFDSYLKNYIASLSAKERADWYAERYYAEWLSGQLSVLDQLGRPPTAEEAIDAVLSCLDQKESQAVRTMFGLPPIILGDLKDRERFTQRTVAVSMCVSQPHVSRLIGAAFRTMKSFACSRRLRPFLDAIPEQNMSRAQAVILEVFERSF
jgi:DNA-directed RNA polymerase specialized sigma subunit